MGTSLRKRLSCESGPARVVSGPAIELEATKAEVRGSEAARSSNIIRKSRTCVSDKARINSHYFASEVSSVVRTAYRDCLSGARARARAEQQPAGCGVPT